MDEDKVIICNKESISEKKFVELYMKTQNGKSLDKYDITYLIGKLVLSSKEPLGELKYIAKVLKQYYKVFQQREEYEFEKMVGVIIK